MFVHAIRVYGENTTDAQEMAMPLVDDDHRGGGGEENKKCTFYDWFNDLCCCKLSHEICIRAAVTEEKL